MKISISSPFPTDSLQGNSVSGRRIASLLADAGHDVELFQDGFKADTDLLIALNAWRSAKVIADFASARDNSIGYSPSFNRVQSQTVPYLIAVMTGSDLFPFDGVLKEETQQSIRLADAIVVTQGEANHKIDHQKIHEIRKSIQLPEDITATKAGEKSTQPPYQGVIVAHLREQKNPFLYLRSIPYLKQSIEVRHYGNANSMEFRENALKYRSNAYHWQGEVPRDQLLAALKDADFLLNTSYIEGSSNAIYESIALGTPVIASAIPGNIGVLGHDYPGLFRPDDCESLAAMLDQFSESADFRAELHERCEALKTDFEPAREQQNWCDLIASLSADS